MRLFVAVALSEEVRAAVATIIGQLRRELARADVKWVNAPNLHVTLQFLGYVADDRSDAVRAALRPAFDEPACDVMLQGVGAFPETGSPRVIWVGIRRGGESLARLAAAVSARLQPLGFEPDDRPFREHVTIGRYRGSGSVADRRVFETKRAVNAGECRVDRVTLFESRLSPHGPTYLPLLETPLA